MGRGAVNEDRRGMMFEDVYVHYAENGSITQEDAARLLGVCPRTFRRWVERYEDGGVDALVDRRLGRSAANAAPVGEVMDLVANYRDRHEGWNVRHFHDRYREEGGTRSYSWVKSRLQEAGAVPKRGAQGPHRLRREPASSPGVLLHQDASTHEWVPGEKWDLVVTMDDATNEIYSAFFCHEEGTASSLRGVMETVAEHGIFSELATDRGSHYWFTPEAGGKVDPSRPTQFKRAMDKMGIGMAPAYSPEARGRSERMFGTLQGRLPQELALAGILDMERANEWLRDVYLPRHNKWFSRPARVPDLSGFAPLADPGILDGILCESHDRVAGNDNCVSFEGMSLQIPPQPFRPNYRKARVRVTRHIDGTLAVWHGPRKLARYSREGKLVSPGNPEKQTRVA